MLITCPSCSAQYNVDDAQIPPQGVNIKCPKCLHQFTVKSQGGAVPLPGGPAPSGGVPLPGAGAPSGGVPLPGAGAPSGGVPLPGAGAPAGGVPLPGAGAPAGGVPLPGAGAPSGGVPLPGAGAPSGGVPLPGAGTPLPGGVPLPGSGAAAGGVPLPGSGAPAGGVPLPGAGASQGAMDDIFGGGPADAAPKTAPPSMGDIFGGADSRGPAPAPGRVEAPPPTAPPGRAASLSDIFGDDKEGSGSTPNSPFHGNNSVLQAGGHGGSHVGDGLLDFIDETAQPTSAPRQLFRIRKRSGRIIGPYDEATILEMFRKGELGGAEEASADGVGWRALSQIPAFAETIQNAAAAALSGLDLDGVDLPGLPTEGADLPGLVGGGNTDLPGLRGQDAGLPVPLEQRARAAGLSTGQLLEAERAKERAQASLRKRKEKSKGRPLMVAFLFLLVLLVGAGVAVQYTTDFGWFGYKFILARINPDAPLLDPKKQPIEEAPPPIDLPVDLKPVPELLAADTYKAYRLGAEQQGKIVAQGKTMPKMPPDALAAAAEQARFYAYLIHFEDMPLFKKQLAEALDAAGPGEDVARVIGKVGQLYSERKWDEGITFINPFADPAKGLKERDLAEVLLWRGIGLLGKRNTSEAMKAVDEAMQAHIDYTAARYLQAKILTEIGKPDYAQDYIKQILAEAPDHPRANLLMGIALTYDLETRAEGEKMLAAIAKAEKASDAAPTQRADAYMGIARLALGDRRWDEAITNMNRAVELVPSSKEVRVAHGNLALQLREFTNARESFEKLIEVNPNDTEALIGLVQAKIGARDALGAYSLMEDAVKAQPKNAQLVYWFGKAAKELLKNDQALKLFTDARQLDPKLPGPHVELIQQQIDNGSLKAALNMAADAQDAVDSGDKNRIRVMKALIFMRQRSHSLAKRELEAAIKENPANIEARVLYVDHLVSQGQVDKAREQAKQALLLDPKNPRVMAADAAVESAVGNNEKAIERLEEATSLAPNDYTLYLRAASAAIDLGDIAGAKSFIDTAGQLQPENPEVLNLRGQVLRSTDPKTARNLFAQAIERSPEDPRLRYELGLTYTGMGQYPEAVDLLQQAIKIDPGFAEAYFQLGRAYRELGRNRDAQKALRECAKLDNGRSDAWVQIAEIHATLGDSNASIRAFRRAVKADPKNPDPVCKMGLTLVERLGENKKHLAEGRKTLQKCVKLAPRHPEAYRKLGDAYKDSGQRRDAIKYYKKHVAVNPEAVDRPDVCDALKAMGSGC